MRLRTHFDFTPNLYSHGFSELRLYNIFFWTIHLKRIIHFVTDLAPSSGVTSVIISLVKQSADQNILSTVIVTKSLHKTAVSNNPNINTILIDQKSIMKFLSISKLILDFFNDRKIIIFHMHTIWDPMQLFFLIIAKLIGVRTVCSTHGMLMPEALNYSKRKKSLALNIYVRKMLAKFDKLHVTSDTEEHEMSSFKLKNIVNIPLGVDCERNTFKFSEKNNVVLFMSRIHPIKGIEELIRAWKNINTEGWKLIVAGPCDYEYLNHIKKIINNNPKEPNITLYGEVGPNDKRHLFKMSKVFILPSKSENFGLVVLESLSLGVPVIVSVNTPWHSIDKYRCGWATKISVRDLEKTLSNVLKLPDKVVETYSKNSFQFARENFEWNKLFRVYNEKLYNI